MCPRFWTDSFPPIWQVLGEKRAANEAPFTGTRQSWAEAGAEEMPFPLISACRRIMREQSKMDSTRMGLVAQAAASTIHKSL
jgi:hypothetical protein